MNHQELIGSNMKTNLVSVIQSMDFGICSNDELVALRSWIAEEKAHADSLTLEDELVGYTYMNLEVLNSRISKEEEKKGIKLVKSIKFNNNGSK